MSYTNGLDKPSDYFNTVLYTGNVSGQSITGVGFQPDFLWIKARSDAYQHSVRNIIRGSTKTLRANDTNAEATQSDSVTSFDSDGFTLGADSSSFVNQNSSTYVAWNWLGSNTTASNTDGDVTSTVCVNTTSGVSIIEVSNLNSNSFGHGLGAEPEFIMNKRTDNTANWRVYFKGITSGKSLFLNTTAAETTESSRITSASSSTITVAGSGNGGSAGTGTSVYFAFKSIKGFSKFGTYTGNGNADGTFVYTGFKPAWVLIKRTNTTGAWKLFDNKRANPFNVIGVRLEANSSGAESSSSTYNIDLLSNGYKLRGTSAEQNGSGSSFIYLAFAESPFVTGASGIPTTAR